MLISWTFIWTSHQTKQASFSSEPRRISTTPLSHYLLFLIFRSSLDEFPEVADITHEIEVMFSVTSIASAGGQGVLVGNKGVWLVGNKGLVCTKIILQGNHILCHM